MPKSLEPGRGWRQRHGGRAWAMLADQRTAYVVINVLVSVVLIGRSYITMRALDYTGLGLAALMQSIMLLIGLAQIGVLNGGYRLLCESEGAASARISDLLYTVIAGIAAVVALVTMGTATGGALALVIGLGAGAGVLTLLRTWMANQFTAVGRLGELNVVSIWAALISLLPLAFVGVAPLAVCLASVALQPLVFVAIVFVRHPDLRPTGLNRDVTLLRRVLLSGFILYLTGIFLQINLQIERWYVAGVLGIETLGHLYLALLLITLFQLVPTSLDAIYVPRIVRADVAGRAREVGHAMRQLFLVELAYCLAAVAAVLLLAGPLLRVLLPTYVGDLRYFELILPGLIAFTLSSPFATAFNVLIRYRSYFVAYGIGTLATAAAFAGSVIFDYRLGLDEVALVRSGGYVLMAALIVAGFVIVTRAHPRFRFGLLSSKDAA